MMLDLLRRMSGWVGAAQSGGCVRPEGLLPQGYL
jgi:hypothetical protein